MTCVARCPFDNQGLDEPVRIRGVSQYGGRRRVRLDFGAGQNASIDLDTTICFFSD